MNVERQLKKIRTELKVQSSTLDLLTSLIDGSIGGTKEDPTETELCKYLNQMSTHSSYCKSHIEELFDSLHDDGLQLPDDGDEMPVITIYRVTREDDGVVLYCIRSSGRSAIDVTEPTFDDAYRKAVELSRTLHGTLADSIHDMSELVEEDPIFFDPNEKGSEKKERYVVISKQGDHLFRVFITDGTLRDDMEYTDLDTAYIAASKTIERNGLMPIKIVYKDDSEMIARSPSDTDYADNDRPGPTKKVMVDDESGDDSERVHTKDVIICQEPSGEITLVGCTDEGRGWLATTEGIAEMIEEHEVSGGLSFGFQDFEQEEDKPTRKIRRRKR